MQEWRLGCQQQQHERELQEATQGKEQMLGELQQLHTHIAKVRSI
jgi:hypothetical protein